MPMPILSVGSRANLKVWTFVKAAAMAFGSPLSLEMWTRLFPISIRIRTQFDTFTLMWIMHLLMNCSARRSAYSLPTGTQDARPSDWNTTMWTHKWVRLKVPFARLITFRLTEPANGKQPNSRSHNAVSSIDATVLTFVLSFLVAI